MVKDITYNPMSKEFQDECKRLGITGCQLTKKYRKEKRILEKGTYKVNCVSRKYTDKELLDYLIQFYREYGRIPTTKDFENNPRYPNYSIYRKRFESWNNALILAGLSIRKREKIYADEELLNELKRFEREERRVPTRRDLLHNICYPSFGTYIDRFGSWNNTLKLVGMDLDTRVMQGHLDTTQEKGRHAEIKVINHFIGHPVDLAGENRSSPCDGICPNGKIYEVKSSKLHRNMFWAFATKNEYKEKIEIYYLLGFNKDYTKLKYVLRVPGEIVEKIMFHVGLNSRYEFNIENTKQYDITDKFKDII